MPDVSIIIPTRHRRDLLQRALDSVYQQVFQDFEVIVVLDGVDQATIDWLTTDYPEVQSFVNERSAGAAESRNRGLREARGEYIAFLDDDDYWLPNYLETQLSHLRCHPHHGLSYTGHYLGDPDSGWHQADTQSIRANAPQLIRLLAECFLHTMSVVVCRREVVSRIGFLNPEFRIVHDWDWYIRILEACDTTVGHIQQPLVYRQRHVGQLVRDYKAWEEEETRVEGRLFSDHSAFRSEEKVVRAFRALYFARIALRNRDIYYGMKRLLSAFMYSPSHAVHLATVRLCRNLKQHRSNQECQ